MSLAFDLDRVKRIWYLSPMRAAKVQASLRIRAVSPERPLLAHTSSESRGTFRQKARSLVPLNGRACAVKICHDGMLEDTNSLDGAHLLLVWHVLVIYLSLVTRKPVFGVCDQVRLKPACSAEETRYRLEVSDIETEDNILSRHRTTRVLIRLRGCAGWSAPLLFAHGINRFSHDVSHS